jgi:hypothetical protein
LNSSLSTGYSSSPRFASALKKLNTIPNKIWKKGEIVETFNDKFRIIGEFEYAKHENSENFYIKRFIGYSCTPFS